MLISGFTNGYFPLEKSELKTFALSSLIDVITYTLDHIFCLWYPIVELVTFLRGAFEKHLNLGIISLPSLILDEETETQ